MTDDREAQPTRNRNEPKRLHDRVIGLRQTDRSTTPDIRLKNRITALLAKLASGETQEQSKQALRGAPITDRFSDRWLDEVSTLFRHFDPGENEFRMAKFDRFVAKRVAQGSASYRVAIAIGLNEYLNKTALFSSTEQKFVNRLQSFFSSVSESLIQNETYVWNQLLNGYGPNQIEATTVSLTEKSQKLAELFELRRREVQFPWIDGIQGMTDFYIVLLVDKMIKSTKNFDELAECLLLLKPREAAIQEILASHPDERKLQELVATQKERLRCTVEPELHEWVSRAEPGEKRAEVADAIRASLAGDRSGLGYSCALSLDLNEFSFHQKNLTSLPSCIGACPGIKLIRVFSNRLTVLPASIGLLSDLGTLWAHYNQIEQLPPTIVLASNLRNAYLSVDESGSAVALEMPF
jgi:hypothetical protein